MVVITFRAFYLCVERLFSLSVYMGYHRNTLRRIELVCDIVRTHYEPGRRDRCYKEVWRRYVCPVYPMCYRTFLNYIGVNVERERHREDNRRQLSLF
ncbi:hypothetical protein [uncultured Parabacteroides sp.]|uniref:hypothetical protein n=2 Tax=uncultured Parabacteroides sp. TaxID=512312 RepID=UPI0026236D0C|nr:hypothetical protein [uncultured Parabacteroides sp.]